MFENIPISDLSISATASVPFLCYRDGAFIAIGLGEILPTDDVPLLQLSETRRVRGLYLEGNDFPIQTPPIQDNNTYPVGSVPRLPQTTEITGSEYLVAITGGLETINGHYSVPFLGIKRVLISDLMTAYVPTGADGIGAWIIGNTFIIENS